MRDHPSAEDIALFVEGTLADATGIEKHLEKCADCFAEVTLSRKLRYMSSIAIVQRITPEQSAISGQIAKRLVARVGGPSAAGSPANDANRDSGPATSLGASIAGALALDGLLNFFRHSTPTPALGETHANDADSHHHDSSAPAANPENSENSSHLSVTHEASSPSHLREDGTGDPHSLGQFLDKALDILADVKTHEDGDLGHESEKSSDSGSDDAPDSHSDHAVDTHDDCGQTAMDHDTHDDLTDHHGSHDHHDTDDGHDDHGDSEVGH
jgi:hypothetical protein